MKSVNELIDALQSAHCYGEVRNELSDLATLTGYGNVWNYDDPDIFVMIIRKMEKQLHCDLCPMDEEELTVQLFEQQEFSEDDEPKQVLTISGFCEARRITAGEDTDPAYSPGDIELRGVNGDILAVIAFH